MDTNHSEGKQGKAMKRAKKRHSIDSEKKSLKCDEATDKMNSGVLVSEGDSGQDMIDSAITDGGADEANGDSNSADTLSMNLVLNLILDEKKKELLECPEVIQFLQQTSRNT